jgi:Flp pilus assembly pilin Flp
MHRPQDHASHLVSAANDRVLAIVASVQVAIADRRERGATAVEYALLLGLMTIAIILGLSVFRSKLSTMFNTYSNTLP